MAIQSSRICTIAFLHPPMSTHPATSSFSSLTFDMFTFVVNHRVRNDEHELTWIDAHNFELDWAEDTSAKNRSPWRTGQKYGRTWTTLPHGTLLHA